MNLVRRLTEFLWPLRY